MKLKNIVIGILLCAGWVQLEAQKQQSEPEKNYQELKTKLQTGWNTWDNRSVLSHVLLPDGLAIIYDYLK